jgi:hypothetical protein
MIVRADAARHLLRRPSMSATPLNAPARPLLTRLALLALSMAVLAASSLAIAVHAPARRSNAEDADRPAFTRRRIVTLPAVVVTASDGLIVVTSTETGAR